MGMSYGESAPAARTPRGYGRGVHARSASARVCGASRAGSLIGVRGGRAVRHPTRSGSGGVCVLQRGLFVC